MRLTKEQSRALASDLLTSLKIALSEEEKKREKVQWAKWRKTPDGRLYSRLPDWMKREISEYTVENHQSFISLADKTPYKMPPRLEDIVNSTILFAMESKTLEELRTKLELKYR